MKLLVLLLFVPFLSFSQDEDTTIYSFVDVEAEFPGGHVELMKFMTQNVEYPVIEFEEPPDRIYLSFVVEKDGTITNVITERSSGAPNLDKCYEDVIRKMPNWTPGEYNGKVVRSRCRIPVNIHYD